MKAKKKSFGIQLISILVVVAIISVGFAAWIITSPIAGDSVQGGFIAQDYIDNTFTISIDLDSDDDGKNESLIFGKPDEVHPANTNSKAFFDNPASYKFNWFSFEKDGTGKTPDEVRTVVFTVTIDPTDDTNAKELEDLLLDRSVMISLTLNNGSTKYDDEDDKLVEWKTSTDAQGNVTFVSEDTNSTQAYELYSRANKLTANKEIDNKQVVFNEAQLVAEPKMTCESGTEDATSDYTEVLFKGNPNYKYTGTYTGEDGAASTVWSDNNAISIILDQEAFVKEDEGNNYVATVELTVDWGTYFDIWYNDQKTIVAANTANATQIKNVNPYYFFNLQNIYKDNNTWIQQAKEAIDTIFALNYVGNTNSTEGAGSGVQYQLSIHPIPYVDVNK